MKPLKLAIAARKGGVGKTAMATSIASLLAKRGNDVTLIDFDSQSSAATALGMDPVGDGTARWIRGEDCFVHPHAGLRLLTGGPGIDQIRISSNSILRNRFEELQGDFVVIDTPPNPSPVANMAIDLADIVFVAAEPHPMALSGAVVLLHELRHSQKRALVLSRVNEKRALHREVAAGASDAFGGVDVFEIRNDTRYERILATGQPASTVKRTNALDDLDRICEWVDFLRSQK